MSAYADYAFYSGTFLGTAIAQANFTRLASLASAEIDALTYDRAAAVVTDATDTATIAKIKSATCAVAEEIQKIETSGGVIQSERVGNFSVTYVNKPAESARVANAAKRYLWNTNLMYRGMNEDER